MSKSLSKQKIILLAALFPLLVGGAPARADDTVVFTAEEGDLQAFDRLLSAQKKTSGKDGTKRGAGAAENSPFGQAVREEAKKLQAEHPDGNSMGAWVSGQRRRNDAGSAGPDSEGASAGGAKKGAEARGLVSGASGKAAEKANKGHGRP